MAEFLKIEEFMDKTFVTLKEDMDVYKAIDILLEKGVTSAAVVDDASKVVGILSEKDCLTLMTKGSYYQLPGGKVKDYMTCDVFCIRPYEDVFRVADLFMQKFFRRIVITDEDNRMVGQITRRDLLRFIKKMHEESREKKIAPIL